MGGGGGGGGAKAVLAAVGNAVNAAVSLVVFAFLDVLDPVLCVVYKLLDFAIYREWKPCYCSSPRDGDGAGGTTIIVRPNGIADGNKVVRISSLSRVQLEEVSDTLYARSSLVGEATKMVPAPPLSLSFTVTKGAVKAAKPARSVKATKPSALWSDCDCKVCHSWSDSPSASDLYVHVQAPASTATEVEDVVFIHGFISSSLFWTETVFPAFAASGASSRYRMLAVDLLGFGRSPKPAESLYTLREHVEMIERSVLQRHKVRSFHLVAHSLGSVLALALAVKHPDAVRSITLLSPPYFPVPEGEEAAASQYVMRKVAPRRVWPAIAFGASMACWYEHVSRTICLTICKHHRLWDFLFRTLTLNRYRSFLIESFMCHTHNAAWHTLHNIICGSAHRMEDYLDAVRDRLRCAVAIFHGENDEILPVECSRSAAAKIPRARLKVFHNRDHITIIIGQEKLFAAELEAVWTSAPPITTN